MVLFCVFVIPFFSFWAQFRDIPFDSASWKHQPKPEKSYTSTRYKMLTDLKSHYLKPGLPKPSIEKLLGSPDYGKDAYNCGVGVFGVDPIILTLEYSEGKLKEFTVVGH
jgi:hypothetical protein